MNFVYMLLYSFLAVLLVLENSTLLDSKIIKLSILYYLIAAIIILVIMYKNKHRIIASKFWKDKIFIYSVILLIFNIITSLFSMFMAVNIRLSISIFLVMILFYLIPKHFLTTKERGKLKICYSIPIIIILSIVSIYNLLIYTNIINNHNWRISYAIYTNPNGFARNLLIGIILIFMCSKELKRLKVYTTLINILLLINIILSSSRSALIATLFIYIVLFVHYYNEQIKGVKVNHPVIFISILVFCIIGFGIMIHLMMNKYASTILGGRELLWTKAFKDIIPQNYILGVGNGVFEYYNNVVPKFKGLSVHNSYINLLMSFGIVSVLIWSCITIEIFNIMRHNLIKNIVPLVIVIAIFIQGFFETNLFVGISIVTCTFWINISNINK